MPAENHSWTLADSDLGCSEGPSSSDTHKPDGQIDIPFGPATLGDGYVSDLSERSDVPYQHDFHKYADVNFAPGRVDVADPNPDSGVPSPFVGDAGQPLDFGAVAPDTDMGLEPDLDGSDAPAASDVSAAAPGVPS
jgi:hypothetical protein